MTKEISRTLSAVVMASVTIFAECFRVYQQSSEEMQKSIRDLVDIVTDPTIDNDDYEMAMITLIEILFPGHYKPSDNPPAGGL